MDLVIMSVLGAALVACVGGALVIAVAAWRAPGGVGNGAAEIGERPRVCRAHGIAGACFLVGALLALGVIALHAAPAVRSTFDSVSPDLNASEPRTRWGTIDGALAVRAMRDYVDFALEQLKARMSSLSTTRAAGPSPTPRAADRGVATVTRGRESSPLASPRAGSVAVDDAAARTAFVAPPPSAIVGPPSITSESPAERAKSPAVLPRKRGAPPATPQTTERPSSARLDDPRRESIGQRVERIERPVVASGALMPAPGSAPQPSPTVEVAPRPPIAAAAPPVTPSVPTLETARSTPAVDAAGLEASPAPSTSIRVDERAAPKSAERRGSRDQNAGKGADDGGDRERRRRNRSEDAADQRNGGAAYADLLDRDERSDRGERIDRDDRRERSDRGERVDRNERAERADRIDRAEGVERVERPDRGERRERVERPDRAERPERAERRDRVERPERVERRDRGERIERSGRRERVERPERRERAERRGR
jgi:hypothetical protein